MSLVIGDINSKTGTPFDKKLENIRQEINKILDFKHAIRRTNYIFNKVFK